MTDVQVLLMFLFLDSKMAEQQLQKWELKFVTELEPLDGASPVTEVDVTNEPIGHESHLSPP